MEMPRRREPASVEDYATQDEAIPARLRRRPGVRVNFSGSVLPKSIFGRIAAAGGLIVLLGGSVAGVMAIHSFLLHDPHFLVPDSSAVEIAGNSHISRAQLLSIFGGDVDRNLFRIPLDDRRAELESLPWVEHATVMRLLPDHIRVAIQERTPVAFVRQAGQIGLVDANGVLLDFGTGDNGPDNAAHYSFPVVTGISASDPISTRAARMHLFLDFMAALDATGEHISSKLSEVDLSDPEDIRAMVPDANGGNEVLVHFGAEKYLERYHLYQQHLAEWRQQYPHLSSADMRYEQQVVLEMQPSAPAAPAPAADAVKPPAPAKPALVAAAHPQKKLPALHAHTSTPASHHAAGPKTSIKTPSKGGATRVGAPR